MPAKKSTAKKSTAKKTSAKTTTSKKSTVRKTTAKKPTARKSPPKKTAARKTMSAKKSTVKASAKKVPAEKTASKPRLTSSTSGRAPARGMRASTKTMAVRPGDLIVLDSAQVGSPSREGEVLQIIQGQVSVSYRVRWADGHQTLISPMSGSARIIKASAKA